MFRGLLIIIFSFYLFSCSQKAETKKNTIETKSIWKPKYANGFILEITNNDTVLIIRNPEDRNQIYYNNFVSHRSKKGLQLPLKRFASLSATHLSFLEILNCKEQLVGFAGLQYIRIPAYQQMLHDNKIVNLGIENSINIEKLLTLSPDAFLCYPTSSNSFETIKKSGIAVLPLPEYLEAHPLARSEYILLFGFLTGKFNIAKNIFAEIENTYINLRDSIMSTSKIKPTCIAGKPIDSRWYVPAGNSYVAQILNDAGYNYEFNSIKGTNVESKLVEEVIAKSENTNYWFFTHGATSAYNLKSLVAELPSITSLNCYKQNKIFMCNSETVDVFGEGIMEPQIILKDLVHATTPFTNYNPKYFLNLK